LIIGVVLCFSLADRMSFDNLNHWLTDIHQLYDQNAVVTLIGNKLDLKNRLITSVEADAAVTDLKQLPKAATTFKKHSIRQLPQICEGISADNQQSKSLIPTILFLELNHQERRHTSKFKLVDPKLKECIIGRQLMLIKLEAFFMITIPSG
jgi:GTPase SAR1 family protein